MVKKVDQDEIKTHDKIKRKSVVDLLKKMNDGMGVRNGVQEDQIEDSDLRKAVVREFLKEKEIRRLLQNFGNDEKEIIPALQKVQEKYGYLPRKSLECVAEKFGSSISKVHGTATFYSQFSLEPQGEYNIKVCEGTACHVKGAEDIVGAIEEELGIEMGEVTEDHKFALKSVRCLGCCSLAPVIMINSEIYGNLTEEKMKEILREEYK